jgi:GTPase SAR1 family protein
MVNVEQRRHARLRWHIVYKIFKLAGKVARVESGFVMLSDVNSFLSPLSSLLRMAGEEVRLMLWDTAGQEEFDAITKAYYRGAQACVVAFSTTDRASFDAVKKWKRKVEDECGQVPTVLVQNKIDMLHEAQVSA